jgi:hypothetical protein
VPAKVSPFFKGGLRRIISEDMRPWVPAQISPDPSFSKRGNDHLSLQEKRRVKRKETDAE